MTSARRRVLITGAAGRIGRAFAAYARSRYDLRLAAHNVDKLLPVPGAEVCHLELSDSGSCQEACRDVDTVVHLGGLADPRRDFYDALLDANIKGVYNMLEAAKSCGCRRVVVASSVQVMAGYPLDMQAHAESPLRPLNMYAVCKCFAEAAAHYFAWSEDLPCVVVRIGNYESERGRRNPHARNLSAFVSARDLNHLLERCVETPGIQFAVAHGLSNNRFKLLEVQRTRELFDYHPRDDGFVRAGVEMIYTDEWKTGRHSRGLFHSQVTEPN